MMLCRMVIIRWTFESQIKRKKPVISEHYIHSDPQLTIHCVTIIFPHQPASRPRVSRVRAVVWVLSDHSLFIYAKSGRASHQTHIRSLCRALIPLKTPGWAASVSLLCLIDVPEQGCERLIRKLCLGDPKLEEDHHNCNLFWANRNDF